MARLSLGRVLTLVRESKEWNLVTYGQMARNQDALCLLSMFSSVTWNFSLTCELPQVYLLPAQIPSS